MKNVIDALRKKGIKVTVDDSKATTVLFVGPKGAAAMKKVEKSGSGSSDAV